MEGKHDWECFGCKVLQPSVHQKLEKAPFFQVDFVVDDSVLLSNYHYHEQAFVKYPGEQPSLNTTYCRFCVDQMPGISHEFKPEAKYTFKQEGYTCWNIQAVNEYSRKCGKCIQCNEEQILGSSFCFGNEKKDFFLIWNSQLASRCFPDPLKPQVWTRSSNLNVKIDKYPGILCNKCFQDWNPEEGPGPVSCQLCEKKYQRWIFHWAMYPVDEGCGCQCRKSSFKDEGCLIYDGDVDPEIYEWTSQKRPENYDENIPFCQSCLGKLVKEGWLQKEQLSDSEEEFS